MIWEFPEFRLVDKVVSWPKMKQWDVSIWWDLAVGMSPKWNYETFIVSIRSCCKVSLSVDQLTIINYYIKETFESLFKQFLQRFGMKWNVQFYSAQSHLTSLLTFLRTRKKWAIFLQVTKQTMIGKFAQMIMMASLLCDTCWPLGHNQQFSNWVLLTESLSL